MSNFPGFVPVGVMWYNPLRPYLHNIIQYQSPKLTNLPTNGTLESVHFLVFCVNGQRVHQLWSGNIDKLQHDCTTKHIRVEVWEVAHWRIRDYHHMWGILYLGRITSDGNYTSSIQSIVILSLVAEFLKYLFFWKWSCLNQIDLSIKLATMSANLIVVPANIKMRWFVVIFFRLL